MQYSFDVGVPLSAMLNELNLENVLCLDIETVPQYPSFDELPADAQKLWIRKASALKKDEGVDETMIYDRAGIYAEFGKIICISVGFMTRQDGVRTFRLKSFFGEGEKDLLIAFANLLQQIHEQRATRRRTPMVLCGHNAREFDFPYLCRRMVVHSIPLPPQLDISGKKPWEITHLDTMELWKFGDFKNYTPLNLLAYILGIPSPKDDIDGSQVGHVYWQEKNLERIVTYCQKDVVTVMQILLRLKGEALLVPDEVIYP